MLALASARDRRSVFVDAALVIRRALVVRIRGLALESWEDDAVVEIWRSVWRWSVETRIVRRDGVGGYVLLKEVQKIGNVVDPCLGAKPWL